MRWTPMKYRLFIIIFLVSCSKRTQDTDSPFGHKTSFEKTGLQETIDSLIKELGHGVIFKIQTDSVYKLFRVIKSLDKFDSSFFNLYTDTCNQIKSRDWKCKTSKCVTTRLIKRDFGWRQGDIPIRLTEYEIFRLEKPNYVNIKIINGIELHELKVQDKSLDILKESIIQDIEQGFNKFEQQKSLCLDSIGLAKAN
jgi:hypothetical protein